MSGKLTDEQLREWAEASGSYRIRALATELLALRAERAKTTQSDQALMKRMAAVYRRADICRAMPDPDGFYCMSQAFPLAVAEWARREASIRAEGSAERAKLEAALRDCKRYAEDHDDEWIPHRVDDAFAEVAKPAESGAMEEPSEVTIRRQRDEEWLWPEERGAKP
jgi:hypothetical protein